MKIFWSVISVILIIISLYVYDRMEEEKRLRVKSKNIFMAIESYDIPYIKKYIKDKKSLEVVKKHTGETPLIYTISYPFITKTECFFIVKLLINAGININAQSSLGNTALLYAVALKEYNLASYLIKNKANPNIANTNGNTPLTVFQNDDNVCIIIKLLVKHGGSISHENNNGDTPLMIAKKYKNPTLIKCIQELLRTTGRTIGVGEQRVPDE